MNAVSENSIPSSTILSRSPYLVSSCQSPVLLEADAAALTCAQVQSLAEKHFGSIQHVCSNFILVVHTECGSYLLGDVAKNPELKEFRTKDGTEFPCQIWVGNKAYINKGHIFESRTFKKEVCRELESKMIAPGQQPSDRELDFIKRVSALVQSTSGWRQKICASPIGLVNQETGKQEAGCVLSAIQHIYLSEKDKDYLQAIMSSVTRAIDPRPPSRYCTSGFLRDWNPAQTFEFLTGRASLEFVRISEVAFSAFQGLRKHSLERAQTAYEVYGDSKVLPYNQETVGFLVEKGELQQVYDPEWRRDLAAKQFAEVQSLK